MHFGMAGVAMEDMKVSSAKPIHVRGDYAAVRIVVPRGIFTAPRVEMWLCGGHEDY